jgi:Cytochrome b(N-terminal)/b6/petB
MSVAPPPSTPPAGPTPANASPPRHSWTVSARERAVAALPPEKLLPDGQPTYVASWIYVFGVASIASLIVIIGSGTILALKGPAWWHETGVGHFFNSIHMWSVELFFFVMVVHLWGKFWMAAWRGGRTRVWITGAVTFLVAVPCALTGYVSQQNFDAQWISTQAKDAMNSVGVGAFFNLTNFGQMYSYHVLLLPAAVVGLVSAHVLLVRRHGVVPPFVLDSSRPAGITDDAPPAERPPTPPVERPAASVPAERVPALSATDGHPGQDGSAA